MPQLKRKKSFIAPFSLTSNTSSQTVDVKSSKFRQKGDETFSPVHISQHVQIITPKTRKKIKQRFAMGFSCVSIRDTSPGFHVPIDLSQSSCISQQLDIKGATGDDEIDKCEEKNTDVRKLYDQTAENFGEELDLELLEETTTEENVVNEKRSDTEDVRDQVLDKESTVHVNIEESRKENDRITSREQNKVDIITNEFKIDGVSTGKVMADTAATQIENDKIKTKNGKRLKKKANPGTALKTKMFNKRFESKTVSKGSGEVFKSARRTSIGFGIQFVGQRRRQTMPEKGTSDVRHRLRYEVGMSDFCLLKSSNKSQSYCKVSHSTRKRKYKQSEQVLKQEVLQTLFKMHDEIKEFLERRKQLCVGQSKSLSDLKMLEKQDETDIVQEE